MLQVCFEKEIQRNNERWIEEGQERKEMWEKREEGKKGNQEKGKKKERMDGRNASSLPMQ